MRIKKKLTTLHQRVRDVELLRSDYLRLFFLLNKGGMSLAACWHRSCPEDGGRMFLRIADAQYTVLCHNLADKKINQRNDRSSCKTRFDSGWDSLWFSSEYPDKFQAMSGRPLSMYHHAIRRCIISDTKSVVKYSSLILWRIDPLLGKDLEINNDTTSVAMQRRSEDACTTIELLLEIVFTAWSVPRSCLEETRSRRGRISLP
jgi:hypothetical protein